MGGFLLEDVFEPAHFVGDQSAGLLVFEGVDLPLVVLDLLVDILEFLLDDIGGGFPGNQLVLLLPSVLLLLLVQHLVDLYDFVLQLAVAFLQLPDVLRP